MSTSTSTNLDNTTCAVAFIPPLNPDRVALIAQSGGKIVPLDPIGAAIYGIDLRQERPPEATMQALEAEMANRGFVVFKGQQGLTPDELIEATKWWGAREMHSTHGVHPATPSRNRHIFRASNDNEHGILGVGPQWHNDGSFEAAPFSHVGYHMVRVPEKGGGTHFCHQGAAFDALPKEKQEYWYRLSSVNSNSGVVHPLVHEHSISKRKSVWLHLGWTGAVLEKLPDEEGFRLLEKDELEELMHDYNNLLNAGLKDGYAIAYEYEDGDCIFIDNEAVAHRASPEAHLPAREQGLRIMDRTTVKARQDLKPLHGLPQYVDIHGPSPFASGVWQGGGIGFRWNESLHFQN